MPHLEMETYGTQYTWVITILFIYLIIIRYKGLPIISRQIKVTGFKYKI